MSVMDWEIVASVLIAVLLSCNLVLLWQQRQRRGEPAKPASKFTLDPMWMVVMFGGMLRPLSRGVGEAIMFLGCVWALAVYLPAMFRSSSTVNEESPPAG